MTYSEWFKSKQNEDFGTSHDFGEAAWRAAQAELEKNMAHRYFLFYNDEYYPYGGAKDIRSSNNSLNVLKEEAVAFIKEKGCLSWAHIYDSVKKEIVYEIIEADAEGELLS